MERAPQWVTVSEAAQRLGVHRNTMRRRIKQWKLRAIRNPRNLREVLLDWREVERHLEELAS